MESDKYYSVKELSKSLSVNQSTIYNWIKKNKIVAVTEEKHLKILIYENREFIIAQIKKKHSKPESAWIPKELSKYNSWHEIIDAICWLTKVSYSSKDDIKHKHFRLDQIFINYLNRQKISLTKTSSVFRTNTRRKIKPIRDDLKRGWYNELSYSFPLKKTTLGLSFFDITNNKAISDIRFSFPSWRITSSYYSIYFYIRSITLIKQESFRIQEHNATILSFKNNVFQPLSNVLWKFPFDIIYYPQKRMKNEAVHNKKLQYLSFKYCFHPRPPYYSARQLVEKIYGIYKKNASIKNKINSYMIFDYLHDFRIWANYLDIDNLLCLWGSGYKAFMDQNLTLITFFIGGFSEICFMSVFKENDYLSQLQGFYDSFVSNNPELENEFINTPIYQRHIIYFQLGWINNKIKLRQSEDPNKVVSNINL